MTTNLLSRRGKRVWQSSRTRTLVVDNFDNAFLEWELSVPQDREIEVLAIPKPKGARMVTLQVKSRTRPRFQSYPIDLYVDIQ